jgi:hypothetical protein
MPPPSETKRNIWNRLFWVCLAAFVLYNLYGYGRHWEFGRYFMPRSLVAADGLHYLDGMPINSINRGFIAADIEEEVALVCLAILFAVYAVLAALIFRPVLPYLFPSRRRQILMKRAIILDMIREAEALGRRQDIDELICYYDRLGGPRYAPLFPERSDA